VTSVGVIASSCVRLGPNMIPADNGASVEAGTTAGFMADQATIAATQAHAAHGTWALAVTMTAANPNLYVLGPMVVGQARYQPYPATPGATFTVMAAVWADTPGATFGWQWQARTAAGGFIGSAFTSPFTALTVGAWTVVVRTVGVGSDPTTAGVTLRWCARGSFAIGQTVHVDKLGVYAGTVPAEAWSLPSAG
jgi:hypothetical protein